MHTEKELQIWGGVECTINRVGNQYFDQLEYSGHYHRSETDLELIASLGIKMLRYPVLWETYFDRLFSLTGYLQLYDLVAEMVKTFRVFTLFPTEEAALVRFLEVIKNFEATGSNSLKEFLQSQYIYWLIMDMYF